MPGKRRRTRGGEITPQGKMTRRKAKSSTVKPSRDKATPASTSTKPCKRLGCCKCKETRQKPSGHRRNWRRARNFALNTGGLPRGFNTIVARHNEIVVGDCGQNEILIWRTGGLRYSRVRTAQFDNASDGMAFDPIHNHLVVLDRRDPVAKVFNSDNTLAFEFSTVLQGEFGKPEESERARCVAVKKDGTILMGYSRGVYTERSPNNGEVLRVVPIERRPDYLAVDSKDRVIVWDYSGVDVTDGNGTTLFTIKPKIPPNLSWQPPKICTGVHADSSGIYVAYMINVQGTGHINHYDLDGKILACLDRGLYYPRGIALTSNGQLAVADGKTIRMYRRL